MRSYKDLNYRLNRPSNLNKLNKKSKEHSITERDLLFQIDQQEHTDKMNQGVMGFGIWKDRWFSKKDKNKADNIDLEVWIADRHNHHRVWAKESIVAG